MLKKTSMIILSLAISIFSYGLYQYYKIPEGVTPLSDQTETVAWLSLVTSIIALITAAIGLIEKIIVSRKEK